MTEATLFLPGLSPVGGKTITATFDGGKLSSNGGVLILREIERKLGLAAVLSRHIPDDRDRTRITHSYSDMTRARMFAIASGHEDCDDLDVLRSDPALKMACGRLPVSGSDLMSQPTLSQAPQGCRPRRGERARQRHTLHRHQPARPGKSPLREGLLRTRAHGESHQGQLLCARLSVLARRP
jgi:hypothetical protein